MASNEQEDAAAGEVVRPSAFSVPAIPNSSSDIAADGAGMPWSETLTGRVEEGVADKDEEQTLAINNTQREHNYGGLVAVVRANVEAAIKVGACGIMGEKDDVDITDAGAEKFMLETDAEKSKIEPADEYMMDQGQTFTAALGVKVDADPGSGREQSVQVQEQEPPPKRKRGRPRRSTIVVEDNHCARYSHPSQGGNKGGFSIADLVWGKVRSHPWWPGQIFDASDASDLACKSQKDGHYLVVYFGDKTFAWCGDSHLKPFWRYFTEFEKQSGTDMFVNAVNDALGEVSRLVELGMTCSCSKQAYSVLKDPKVENAGVKEGTRRSATEKVWIMESFDSRKLMDYVQMLALNPCGGADNLDLAIAKAHLKAFRRSNGCPELPVFVLGEYLQNYGVLSQASEEKLYDSVLGPSSGSSDSSPDQQRLPSISGTSMNKNYIKDTRKRKSLSELMGQESLPHNIDDRERDFGGQTYLNSSSRRQKIDISYPSALGKSKMKKLDSLGDLAIPSSDSNMLFIVEQHIGQIAKKRTLFPTVTEHNPPRSKRRRSTAPVDPNLQLGSESVNGLILTDCSPSEILSQLCLAGREPFESHDFLGPMIGFLTEFSNWVISRSREDTKQAEKGTRTHFSSMQIDSTDLATYDYIQDSYWSDIIVCSNFEELGSVSLNRNNESRAKNQENNRKNLKQQPDLFLQPDSLPKIEPFVQIDSARASIQNEFEAERPLDNIEEGCHDCISISYL